MKIIFCGDRKWQNRRYISDIMHDLKKDIGVFTVIEGEAPGADSIARSLAELTYHLPFEPYPAKWDLYGKAAGPIRNTEMLEKGNPDGVIAFHADINSSKGTRNMVEPALEACVPVLVLPGNKMGYELFVHQILYRKEEREL